MTTAPRPCPPNAVKPPPPVMPPRKRLPVSGDSDLKTLMLENAKQAGYYKGVLEGIICQAVYKGEYYIISTEVFEKLKEAICLFDDKAS